jgi:hypothetical protein
MLAPGVINTSAVDHAPLEQMQMMQFSGGHWQRFGPVRSGVDPGSVSDSFKTIFRYGTAKRDLANQLNANTVTLITGSFGSTYAQMGADLASVLDNGTDLRILPVMGIPSPIWSERISPTTSAISWSMSPRCSTRKCTCWHRSRSTALASSTARPSRRSIMPRLILRWRWPRQPPRRHRKRPRWRWPMLRRRRPA